MFNTFSERLRQAAQAGAEQFDAAGHALQHRVAQAQLTDSPTKSAAVLSGTADSPARERSATASPKPVAAAPSPLSERGSMDVPRSSALASRLSSLVTGTAKPSGSPIGKNAHQKIVDAGPNPALHPAAKLQVSDTLDVLDPVSIPLPPSPPPSPLLRPFTPPSLSPITTTRSESDAHRNTEHSSSAIGTAAILLNMGGLFNTPRKSRPVSLEDLQGSRSAELVQGNEPVQTETPADSEGDGSASKPGTNVATAGIDSSSID